MKRMLILLVLLLVLLPGKLQAAGPRSSVLMELSTGELLQEDNAHEKLAPASVTKIMTMLLTMEAIDTGKIQWEDLVTASETAAAKGGSQIYLKVGETMTVRDMLKSVAVSSANDCACALAEHLCGSEEAFVEQMNEKARSLGMKDTHFVNCTGLDDSEEAQNHRTTAYDIALMSRELLLHHPEIKKFTTIWMDTVRNGSFGLSNTNRLVRFYKGTTGLKTGYTSGAGFCLSASARREDMELIAVVLGADSSRDRFGACKSLLDYGFANFALAEAELPEDHFVAVDLGKQEKVPVKLQHQGGLLVDKAQKNGIQKEITLEERVPAPVKEGQQLGTLTLKAGDQILREIPLLAAAEVEKQTRWDLFRWVLGKVSMARL